MRAEGHDMLWVRGELVSDDALTVGVRDRTFEHGLGLFESFRTWNGHPTLLRRHLGRLRDSARELGLPLEAGQLPDVQAVAALVAASRDFVPPGVDARLRITLTGGLAAAPPLRSIVWMSVGPLPAPIRQKGAIIAGSIEVPADDPLARHKTLNYWRNAIAHSRALDAGADEVLCVTHDRLICEASRSNVFLVRDGCLHTPAADGRLLPGIMRQVVLERARAIGIEAVEESLPMECIATADEAFLTNAVRGILPVGRLFDVEFAAPGPHTNRLWSDIRRCLDSIGIS
jgi:branched-chain amino acid aminotransferase